MSKAWDSAVANHMRAAWGAEKVWIGDRQIYPIEPTPIPEGAMRVAPGSDAVVWRINSDRCGEL